MTKKCPWCGGELFRVYGAMNYPWDYSCSKCNGYCFERDVLRADAQREEHRGHEKDHIGVCRNCCRYTGYCEGGEMGWLKNVFFMMVVVIKQVGAS